MKPIWILVLTFIFFAFSNLLLAQQLHTVIVNHNIDNYVEPLELKASPFDQVKFISTGGDFEITIPNANEIFNIDANEIRIKLSDKNPESPTYTLKDVDEKIEHEYDVYCNSTGGEPDAPPKIIVHT